MSAAERAKIFEFCLILFSLNEKFRNIILLFQKHKFTKTKHTFLTQYLNLKTSMFVRVQF